MFPEARTALRRSANVRASAKLHLHARTCTRRRTAQCHPLRRSFQAEDPRRVGTGCGHWRQGQSGASSALSRRVLRSAPCRKQQLLV